MGRGRCGRSRTAMGRGRYGRKRATMGRGLYGRRRTTTGRGRYGRRRDILGRGGWSAGARSAAAKARSAAARARRWTSLPGQTASLDYRQQSAGQQRTAGRVGPTLFVAHLTSRGKWHAFSVGGGLVRPTRPGGKVLIGDSAASQSIALVSVLAFTTRDPLPPTRSV